MAIDVSTRDRRLLSIGGVVLGLLLVVALPVGAETLVSSRRAEVDELKSALADVQDARGKIRERQEKRDALAARYGNPVQSLPSFIEQAARAQKLEVSDSTDPSVAPTSKRYAERYTVIHIKKGGMYAIAKFIESMEKSGHPIVISRLNIHKRSGEPDTYDVELGVRTFDRIKEAPKPAASAEKKP